MFFKMGYLMPIFIASFLNLTPAAANNKISDQDPWGLKDAKIVASWSEENIKMYALDWKIDSNPTYKPEFILSDLDNDGKKELIVISVSGTGTGIYESEVHVLGLILKAYFTIFM